MLLVKRNVFDQATKTVDGGPDKGLVFWVDPNCLGITTAFKIEHAIIAPAVFVIANEGTFRVGRKGGFTSAAKPKKQGCDAILTFVGRAVQGENAFFRKKVVHVSKDGFLDLTSIKCAAYQNLFRVKIKNNHGR